MPQPMPADTALSRWIAASDPPDRHFFDELRESGGEPRPAWTRFFDLCGADAAELDRRAASIAGQLRRDGVTHNIAAEAERGSYTRPWSLELLPLLIEPADWARIERGIAQRAALLDSMLADLYGEQRLLHEGLLPPALVFRHPGFIRPLAGISPPGRLRLHIVAFDIGRGPDGQWWVVSQRTQAPSGLGYVMHNRLIVSRLFPDAFREMRVQRLASSYRRLLDTLFTLAGDLSASATPRVVLLTPGPYTPTYFEHAYLARYLGLVLVEGADLTVRDERLFMKTVEGLEPVHGMLRRLDDDWCDPLELRSDSALGVPGLLQAARAGNVVIANALGSGFIESPAVQGFLPAICRRLLGEEIEMPSLATWWCGEQAAWDTVAGALAGRVVRPSFGGQRSSEGVPDVAERIRKWRATIEADPDAYTVQELLRVSRTPRWAGESFDVQPALLRVYAIADPQRRWHVLPGGMTRVATKPTLQISMGGGGSSLDTWVMTEGAVDLYSMLPRRLTVDDIAARRRPVASRTAENLFWLGRYTERTEQLVRLARATMNVIDADTDNPPAVLEALSMLGRQFGLVPAGVPSLVQAPHLLERALLAAMRDDEGAISIAYNLAAMLRAAGSLRDRLSVTHWRLLTAMHDDFAERTKPAQGRIPSVRQARRALDQIALQLAAVTGAQADRMTRDHGWRMLSVGRLTERLIALTRILHAWFAAPALAPSAGMDLLLELFDSAITFRSRYQRHDELLALADVLVLDEANPRALAGVLRRLRTEAAKLPGDEASTQALRALLPAAGAGIDLEDLRALTDEAMAERLAALTLELGEAGGTLSDHVSRHYFAHADAVDRVLAA